MAVVFYCLVEAWVRSMRPACLLVVELERYLADETLRVGSFWGSAFGAVEGLRTSSSALTTVEECWEGWCLVAPVSCC